jgi:hypothetical protein
VAEFWDVLEGLRYVYRLGFRKVEVNIDSAAMVQVVCNRQLHSSLGNALVKQIWLLLEKDWCVEILHVYREANKCADALANIGYTLDYEIEFYEDCPPHISELCIDDRMGFTTPRLVVGRFLFPPRTFLFHPLNFRLYP